MSRARNTSGSEIWSLDRGATAQNTLAGSQSL
jgi:hypothetical protein